MSKILLYGGTGLVGSRILELLSTQFEITAPIHSEVDLTDSDQIKKNIDSVSPDQILYAAGYTNVDEAEKNQELSFALNAEAIKTICETSKVPVHYLSTDYVFNGKKAGSPYTEEDQPDPISVYAKSKRKGEIVTLEKSPKNSVLRLIMPYSAVYTRKLDLARSVLTRLKNGEKVYGVVDQNINPIFVDDLISAISKILENQASGIYHLGASSFTTPEKFVKLIAQKFDLEQSLITPMTFEEFKVTRPAKRPQHSWIDTSKFRKRFGDNILHTIEEGVELFKAQMEQK